MDLAGLLIERLRTFRSKEMLVNATAGDAEEVANYGLQFDLDRAIDAIAAQEKKFKKTSSTGVKLVKDTTDNPFDTKFADVEECIFYERFGQAEKILKEILQQKSDEWLAVYKLLDLYVLTEKYAEFINFYEGLPAELKEMTPRIWSKIESLHEKVVSESVRFESAEKAENETPTSDKDQTLMIEVPAINAPKRVEPKVVENKDYIDLKKNYPLALEGDEVNDEINIEALPTAEVKELPKSTSNTQEIQKAQIALAKAYIDMGEYADAKDILNDLKKEAAGNHLKKIEALLESIS